MEIGNQITIWAAITEPDNEHQTLYDHEPSDFEVFCTHGPVDFSNGEKIVLYKSTLVLVKSEKTRDVKPLSVEFS